MYDKSIKAEPWYIGKMKRVDAEKLLLLSENDNRSFVVRDVESRTNAYYLSGELVEHIIFYIISRLNML